GLGGEPDGEETKRAGGLLPGGGLKATRKCRKWRCPQSTNKSGAGRIPPRVPAPARLPPQSPAGQAGVGRDPLSQVRHERIHQSRTRLARSVHWRFKAAGDSSANRLPVETQFAGNRRDRQPLSMKVKNHHNVPKLD